MSKRYLMVSLFLICVLSVLFCIPAKAGEYQRIKLSGVTAASTTNTAAFYNAKILAVRATNLAGATVTNTMVLTQVTSDGLTNTIASITSTSSGASDVSSNSYVQLRNDVLTATASSNFVYEVVLDNNSR